VFLKEQFGDSAPRSEDRGLRPDDYKVFRAEHFIASKGSQDIRYNFMSC